jgi:diadenosine tetraphosphate (Ap4A) HIT family hydrolase
MQEAGGLFSVRERIWSAPGWRVAHAFNSSLAGWLVVLPTRHLESVDELTVAESEALGNLLRETSGALKSVTGCLKTYVMMFAEAEGFSHLHFHVVPRMSDFAEDRLGPKVFAYLKEQPLSDFRRDQISLQVRRAFEIQESASKN